jgi:ATP/maltotriose-dependent transcriptional regulator MalT
MQGMVHLLEGRPDEAEQLFNRVRSEIRHGIPMTAGVMDASDAYLLLHQGRLDAAREALSRIPQHLMEADLPQWMAVRSAARGWLAWEEADLETAERAFQLSQECCAAVGYHAFELGPIFLPLHVDVLCRLDQVERAAHVVEQAVAVHRVADRFFRASLAGARFRLHPCAESATQAEEVAKSAPWPWLRAMIECWRGELLEDVPAARAGREGFGSIGAQRGVERATAVLRRLGVSTGGRHAAPRGEKLSAREWEVAELVAEGLTNAAIAKRLFLSRPTVASHIANILTKLDFASRAQIAAWVADQHHARGDPGSRTP